MLLGNDSCGSYKAVAHEKDGDNALFPESDDNSSIWYGNELLWAPSSPQKVKLGIVLFKGQVPGGRTVDVVLRLSSLSFHDDVSKTIIELKKHLITASYVDDETSMLHEMAKNASITVLSETTSHNLAFSMNLSPLNSVRQRKNVLNPKPLIRKLCKEVAHNALGCDLKPTAESCELLEFFLVRPIIQLPLTFGLLVASLVNSSLKWCFECIYHRAVILVASLKMLKYNPA
ncbi:hypothetical protein YC2023_077349 [Brassica napus]